MAIRFKLDPEKVVEAILYISANSGSDKYCTLKALYVADKLHLERYGRFVTGDTYRALEKGPAPDNAYDIVEYVAGRKTASVAPFAKEAFSVGNADDANSITPLRKPDIDVFSDSDIECLDEVIARIKDIPPGQKYKELWQDVHDLAWEKSYEETPNALIDVEKIAAQFKNSDELIEYLKQA